MAELSSMQNIGKGIEEKLKSIDICSAEELIQIGSKEAFRRLKVRYPSVCAVYLYTLQGAIDNIEYNQLPDEVRCSLRSYSDELKELISSGMGID